MGVKLSGILQRVFFILQKIILIVKNPLPRYRKTQVRRSIIDQFHKLYFYTRCVEKIEDTWMGVPVLKYPTDLMVYQEILWELKPDILIETGSERGGSALYFAMLFDYMKEGTVISIDRDLSRVEVDHPRIEWIEGDSTMPDTIERLKMRLGEATTVMVTLDSSHVKDHVLKEMELYAPFVSVGSYLIVEDTQNNGHPVQTYYPPDYGPGPMEAVEKFLTKHPEFHVDHSREKYLLTSNPHGFLKRIK
jgi:cephalosporin hydroxylase